MTELWLVNHCQWQTYRDIRQCNMSCVSWLTFKTHEHFLSAHYCMPTCRLVLYIMKFKSYWINQLFVLSSLDTTNRITWFFFSVCTFATWSVLIFKVFLVHLIHTLDINVREIEGTHLNLCDFALDHARHAMGSIPNACIRMTINGFTLYKQSSSTSRGDEDRSIISDITQQ